MATAEGARRPDWSTWVVLVLVFSLVGAVVDDINVRRSVKFLEDRLEVEGRSLDVEKKLGDLRQRKLDAYHKECGPIRQVWEVGQPEEPWDKDKEVQRLDRLVDQLREDIHVKSMPPEQWCEVFVARPDAPYPGAEDYRRCVRDLKASKKR